MSDTEFTAEEQEALKPEAPEPVEAPVEEPQQEPAPQTEEERAKAFVPIGELQKERNRRKEEAKRREEVEQQLSRAAGRLDVLEQAWRQPNRAEQQPLGSIDEAPVDHVKAHERELADLRAWRQEQEKKAQEQAGYDQYANAILAHEHAFSSQTPDYYDAINWLRTARDGELEDAGYAPEDRARIIRGEIDGISGNVLARKGNPAEAFYKMAVRRGYKKAAPENGVEKVERIERGQQAGRSLSQAGGAAPPGKLSLERLVSLPDHEFEKIANDPRKWREVMGG